MTMKDIPMGRMTTASGISDPLEDKTKPGKKETDHQRLLRMSNNRVWLALQTDGKIEVREIQNCESNHVRTWLCIYAPYLSEETYEEDKARRSVVERAKSAHFLLKHAFKGKFGATMTSEEKAKALKDLGV